MIRRAVAAAVAVTLLPGAGLTADCPAAPDPVLALGFDSRYAPEDDTRSRTDDAAEQAAEAAVGPLDDFLRDLAEGVAAMLTAPDSGDRAEIATCLMARIAVWARADALARLDTETAALTVGSRLAAFGIVASEARAAGAGGGDLAAVASWLQRRMHEQMRFWEAAPRGAASGNLRAWAGLAGAAVSGLVDDPVLRGWAAWSVAYVACSAAPDGSLPREMARGSRALHYQLHAVAPLVTATLLLERQGMPVRGACPGALDRAVHFALSDLDSGARTQAITGAPQSLFGDNDPLQPYQLAWIEAYLALGGDPAVAALAEERAAPMRPLSFSKLGGNQTLIWRRGRD